MSDLWHGDGIFQCEGCGRTYAEYVNGCPAHDDGERRVVLVGIKFIRRYRRRYLPVPDQYGSDDE